MLSVTFSKLVIHDQGILLEKFVRAGSLACLGNAIYVNVYPLYLSEMKNEELAQNRVLLRDSHVPRVGGGHAKSAHLHRCSRRPLPPLGLKHWKRHHLFALQRNKAWKRASCELW